MLLRAVVIAGIATSLFVSGWTTNGWRLNNRIADIEASHAKQQQTELIEAIAERDRLAELNAEISAELEVARSETRTEIRYIEREVRDVVEDNLVCALGPDAVGLLNAAAVGGGSSGGRSPRRNLVVEVSDEAGDDDGD